MIRNLYTFATTLFFAALALTSCKNSANDDISQPEEKGQFKIVFGPETASKNSTKAEQQKDWEKRLDEVYLFVYKTEDGETTAPAAFHQFSQTEKDKKTCVLSLPNIDYGKNYTFYVVANHTITTPGTQTIQSLKALITSEALATYYNDADYQNVFDNSASGFLFAQKTGQITGFVMSGSAAANAPAQDGNAPTKINVEITRIVAKLETKTYTTQAFEDIYGSGTNGLGGTLTVQKIEILNIPSTAAIIKPATFNSAGLTYTTLLQNATINAQNQYLNLFYIYENGIYPTSTTVDQKPQIKITALYTFGGNSSTITYLGDLEGENSATTSADKIGLFQRNGYYQIEAKINGLTPNEIKATVSVKDWKVVNTQTIPFGG